MCSVKKPGSKHLLNELSEACILHLLKSKFPLYIQEKLTPMNWYILDSVIFGYSPGLIKVVCQLGFLYGQMVEMIKEDSVWNNNGFDIPVKIFLKSIMEKLKE